MNDSFNDPFSALSSNSSVQQPALQTHGDAFDALASPGDITRASAQTGSQDENGECQKFVEQMVYGHAGIFPSAIDAWDAYAKDGQARMGTQGVKPGDLLYFAPDKSNQDAGHTGIFMGGDKFISATDNGVMPYSLTDWQKQTGQQLLGYVKP